MAPQTWMLAASISRLVKPRCGEQVEARRGEVVGVDAEFVAQKSAPERPFVEGELDVEGGRQRLFQLLDRLRRKALGLERGVVDRRRAWPSVPWPTA